MVAYADDLPEDLEVFSNPESEWLLNRFAAAAASYTALQVVPRVDASMWGSDHSPFWDQGFSALCAIEDSPLNNPNYHTATDTVDTLNFELLTSATQATLAAAADLAQPLPILSYLPQIATGSVGDGIFRTTFILFNNTDHETAVGVKLNGKDGVPLSVNIPGLGTGSEFTLNLPAGASRMVQTAAPEAW